MKLGDIVKLLVVYWVVKHFLMENEMAEGIVKKIKSNIKEFLA